MNTCNQKTIGVIRMGAFGNYFEALSAIEDWISDNKIDSICLIMNINPDSCEAMGAYVYNEGFDRNEEETQTIVMGEINKKIGIANENSLEKKFLIFLRNEILVKEESENSGIHKPCQGYDGKIYPVRYFGRTGATGNRFWVYLGSRFLHRCFIFFIQKEFQHHITTLDSVDKIPDCNEYKIIYTGRVWGGALDDDWVPKLLRRSASGRRDRISQLENKIQKCKECSKKEIQRLNQLIDNYQEEIDRLKDLR